MLITLNKFRMRFRRWMIDRMRFNIRHDEDAVGHLETLPWLRYFAPAFSTLRKPSIKPITGKELLLEEISTRQELYLVDENGVVLEYAAKKWWRLFSDTPLDAIGRLNDSQLLRLRYLVVVNVYYFGRRLASVTLFKFPVTSKDGMRSAVQKLIRDSQVGAARERDEKERRAADRRRESIERAREELQN